jgi:hypothetical protein
MCRGRPGGRQDRIRYQGERYGAIEPADTGKIQEIVIFGRNAFRRRQRGRARAKGIGQASTAQNVGESYGDCYCYDAADVILSVLFETLR